MKYVMFYELADGAAPLAQQHFPAHMDRLTAFHQRGLLLMVGTFADRRWAQWVCSPAGRQPRSSWPTIRSSITASSAPGAFGSGTRSSSPDRAAGRGGAAGHTGRMSLPRHRSPIMYIMSSLFPHYLMTSTAGASLGHDQPAFVIDEAVVFAAAALWGVLRPVCSRAQDRRW